MEFSRRRLLGVLGLLFLFLTFHWRTAMAQLFFKPKRKMKPTRFDNPYKAEGKALVSIVRGGNILTMTREAVSLIGGFEKIGKKDKTILKKPIFVSGEPTPATTNPEVVRA